LPNSIPLYTVREAARLTGYHPRSLNRLLKAGQIEAVRVGWQYLFDEQQVAALKARRESRR
jgi:excisionase family DNA binding protein